MKVAIITANLGNFDPPSEIVEQNLPNGVELSVFKFTDENFPPRRKAMSSRLQARIPKMFGWEMAPGFDYYIWIDGSFSILNKETISWYLKQCDSYDGVMFEHPDRKSIRSEAEYVRKRITDGNEYLMSRYNGELIDDQIKATISDPTYPDDLLIATCSFIYKDSQMMRNMLKEWWVHTSRYHIIDQLSIPYIIYNSDCMIKILKEDIYHIPYLTYTRNKKKL
jgi:hypothetical protein